MSQTTIGREEFEELRARQELFKFRVVTGSMEPLIAIGSGVIVEVTADIKPHDIIVFWQDNKLICHVFWKKNEIIRSQGHEVLITRPLLGRAWDVSIQPSQVLGKVLNYKVPRWYLWRMYWADFRRFRKK